MNHSMEDRRSSFQKKSYSSKSYPELLLKKQQFQNEKIDPDNLIIKFLNRKNRRRKFQQSQLRKSFPGFLVIKTTSTPDACNWKDSVCWNNPDTGLPI